MADSEIRLVLAVARHDRAYFRIMASDAMLDQLTAVLPAAGRLVHSVWSGECCYFDGVGREKFAPFNYADKSDAMVSSIYPGWVALQYPLPGLANNGQTGLVISYGDAEARGPLGRQYVRLVGRLDERRTSASQLAAMLSGSLYSGAVEATLSITRGLQEKE